MDCRDYEKIIPEFISGKMDYLTMKDFVNHINNCAECKEELVIQFLIGEGLNRLEEGRAFDLQKELDNRMNDAAKKVQRQDNLVRFGTRAAIVIAFGTLAVMTYISFMG